MRLHQPVLDRAHRSFPVRGRCGCPGGRCGYRPPSCFLPEGHVEHDIGGLAADAGQRLQRRTVMAGTWPSCSLDQQPGRQGGDVASPCPATTRCDGYARPMPASAPSATMAGGVGCGGEQCLGVTLLTEASVAWAESTTATSRVKGSAIAQFGLRRRIGHSHRAWMKAAACSLPISRARRGARAEPCRGAMAAAGARRARTWAGRRRRHGG